MNDGTNIRNQANLIAAGFFSNKGLSEEVLRIADHADHAAAAYRLMNEIKKHLPPDHEITQKVEEWLERARTLSSQRW